MFARIAARTGVQLPSPPAFARSAERAKAALNFRLPAPHIRPIARRIPTHREPLDKYVRFLSEIENRDWASILASKSLRLSAVNSPLPDAWRSVKPMVEGALPSLALRIISRPKVSRQSAGNRQVNVPNQHRRIRRTNRWILLNERDREENCGRKNKAEYAKPATTQTGNKIHVSRGQVGGEHLWQARNFCHCAFQTRNSRGLI